MGPNGEVDRMDEIIHALNESAELITAIDRSLSPYLRAHEDDIFLDINDFGDLAEVFELMFGRKPGNTI